MSLADGAIGLLITTFTGRTNATLDPLALVFFDRLGRLVDERVGDQISKADLGSICRCVGPVTFRAAHFIL